MSKLSLTCFFLLGSLYLCIVRAVPDLTSPEVFDVNFYINNNVAVLRAGVRDVSSAKNHWLHHGIDMGLQASGSFHSMQYLAQYSDLRAAFGEHNYRSAVTHFLDYGLLEHRLGVVIGGYGGRWTVTNSDHTLFLGASSRMGAAVDSLVWNNKEFINAWDHGRELQMAMNFPPNGECFNPTEAGGRDDSQNSDTHTIIQNVTVVHENTLVSKVLPAYWLQPGHVISMTSGSNCQKGMGAINKEFHYPHPFSKTVTLDCPGVNQPCVKFTSTFTIAGSIPDYTVLQMEAPTGYLTGDFTHFQSLDPHSQHLVPYDNRKPIVISTPDNRYAMGVYAPPNQDSDLFMYYGKGSFPSHTLPAATNKWNVVFRKNTFPPASSHVLNYVAFICVGNVDDVTMCLKTLLGKHEDLIG